MQELSLDEADDLLSEANEERRPAEKAINIMKQLLMRNLEEQVAKTSHINILLHIITLVMFIVTPILLIYILYVYIIIYLKSLPELQARLRSKTEELESRQTELCQSEASWRWP